ncbi:MAG: hypothetical protein IH958_04950 [Chloroflexi bacterium]|nr:hypothetical protein [Chloroflexota bacterium]
MALGIIGWTFWAVWLAAPVWTFFDAEERGRSAILWAVLTLVFGPIGLGVYAITLGRGESSLLPGARGRQYFFTAAFFFLMIVYATLVGLVVIAIDAAWSNDPLSGDDARTVTAVLLALLIFGLPLWAFHWIRAQELAERPTNEDQRRALLMRLMRGYGGAVLLVGTLVSIGFGIFLVFALIAAILSVYEGGKEPFIPTLAFLPVTLFIMAYHWYTIFGSGKYGAPPPGQASAAVTGPAAPAPTDTAASTQTPAAAASRRFCGDCGAENAPGSRFCTGCGVQLHLAGA